MMFDFVAIVNMTVLIVTYVQAITHPNGDYDVRQNQIASKLWDVFCHKYFLLNHYFK